MEALSGNKGFSPQNWDSKIQIRKQLEASLYILNSWKLDLRPTFAPRREFFPPTEIFPSFIYVETSHFRFFETKIF